MVEFQIPEELQNALKGEITPELAVHLWLCVFMSGVGLMKASGCLKHDLSRLVGLLELIGGAVLLNPLMENPVFYVAGAGVCLLALGLVISVPKKRASPVCWVHAVLCMVFLYQLNLPLAKLGVKVNLDIEDRQAMALAGLAPLITGVILGSLLRSPTKSKAE